MAIFLFANDANTTLAAPITNTALSLTVASGTGALFPNPSAGQQFALTMVDASTGEETEIMYSTARSGDTFTVIRGQEGTIAQAWIAGDLVGNFWTAGQAAAMQQSGALQPARTINQGTTGGAFTMTTLDNGGGVLLLRSLPLTTVSSVTLPPSPNGATYNIEDGSNIFGLGQQAVTVTFPAGTVGPNAVASVQLIQPGQCARFRFYADSNYWSFKP